MAGIFPWEDTSDEDVGTPDAQQFSAMKAFNIANKPLTSMYGLANAAHRSAKGTRTILQGPWGKEIPADARRNPLNPTIADPARWRSMLGRKKIGPQLSDLGPLQGPAEPGTPGWLYKKAHHYGQRVNPRSFDRYATNEHLGVNDSFLGKRIVKAKAANPEGLAGRLSDKFGGTQLWDRNIMARLGAFNKTAGGLDAGQRTSMETLLKEGGVVDPLAKAGFQEGFEGLTDTAIRQAMLGAGKGVISQKIAGYAIARGGGLDAGARDVVSKATQQTADRVAEHIGTYGRGGEAVGRIWGQAAGKEVTDVAGETLEKIGVKAAAGKVMTTLGVELAGDLPADLAGVGEIMMIAQMAKAGVDLGNALIIQPGIAEAKAGAKSLMGEITKAPFGMGYHDTAAAATSRSRGVMAIQASRLNGRSALGSEAGLLHARYG